MITHKLRDKTLKLLRERPCTVKLSDIADATKLPITWLKKFLYEGDNICPSVSYVETLYEHLSKRKLKL